ncbi:MAG: hypothetical protein ABIX46_07945 [Burkholderiaceae bacterium]
MPATLHTDTPMLALRIARIDEVALDIRAYEQVLLDGSALPPLTLGAHIKVQLPSDALRKYSLRCGGDVERLVADPSVAVVSCGSAKTVAPVRRSPSASSASRPA